MTSELNPSRERRWYRNRKRGWIGGVCAGLADYLGVPLFWVRLLILIPLFSPLLPLLAIAYLIAVFVLPQQPDDQFVNQEHEQFWRKATNAPSDTCSQVNYSMERLELRLQQLESYVTSHQYQVNEGLSRTIRQRGS